MSASRAAGGAPERVVVTGLGVVAPNGNGKEAFARALRRAERDRFSRT